MAVGGFGEDDDPSAVFSQLAIAQEEKEAAKAEAEAAAAAKAEKLAAEAEKRAAAQATIAGGGGNGGAMTTSPELELKLSRAMLNGNFDQAVACCLEAGRVADALVLAASGGPELWTQTRDAYLSSSTTFFPFGLNPSPLKPPLPLPPDVCIHIMNCCNICVCQAFANKPLLPPCA